MTWLFLASRWSIFFPKERAKILVDYVAQKGGAVVFARGQAFNVTTEKGRLAQQIVAPIEPVEWGSQRLRRLKLAPTSVGRTSPLTRFDAIGLEDLILSTMPDLIAATRIHRAKPTSVVLWRQVPVSQSVRSHRHDRSTADGQGMPALAYQQVGGGRVFSVLGDGLWRWAFLPVHQQRLDSVFTVFWTRVIQWLAMGGEFFPGQDVSLTLNQHAALPGEHVTATASFRRTGSQVLKPRLRVTDPDGSTRIVSMSLLTDNPLRYTATVRPERSGVYGFDLVTDPDSDGSKEISGHTTTRLAVYDQSLERLDVSARPDVLAKISRITGGRCYDHPEQLFDDLDQLRQARTSDRRFHYDFNQPTVLAMIVAVMGLEWFIRRRRGLL